MAGYFILIFGMLAFALHVPGLVVPMPHRRLGWRFVQRPSNLRLVAVPMAAIGVGAILVSPDNGATRWLLLVVGIYQIVSGMFLPGFPGQFRIRMESIFAGPLRLWIGRAVTKCVVAMTLMVWGVMLILG